MTDYRQKLYEYLKNRMNAMAPNLTLLVGELVGARLIAHAGTLINLAKHPASTVQILGAEKALFRALKTKKDTPKYGLIYHAQLVGQASTKLKGKASRMLAAKAALAARYDALGEEPSNKIGIENRAYLEARIKQLETGDKKAVSAMRKKFAATKYENAAEVRTYPAAQDSNVSKKKRKHSEAEEVSVADEADEDGVAEVPKKKKKKVEVVEEEEVEIGAVEKKKKKKRTVEEVEEEEVVVKKHKKKK